ncbi:MAG: Holliday junction branch migration protein RuvA [Verrucomicrobiae bacterium]|nr:Holliday junction branch migration protein RuvA [Verrucomicrobiae bacterium]
MIGRLKGRVEAIGESHLILDVNGVGYEVQATARALRGLKFGDEATLTIDTHVREDAIRLYGFQSEVERSWFRTLQTVQGVGAKVALSVLSVLSTGELASAIALGNWSAVQQAQGVGKVVAQRIVAELKNKVPATSFTPSGTVIAETGAGPGQTPPEGNAAMEAVSALTNLGYNPAQAMAAVGAALKDLGADTDTAKLIRRGLKELAR